MTGANATATDVDARTDGPSNHDDPETNLPGIVGVLRAHSGERHMIVIQDFPDPDAIASAYAHQLISSRFDIQTEIVYAEQISHLQNIALVKLLNIATTRFDPSMDLSRFDGAVFIDTQGTTSAGILEALEDAAVPAVIVVDHHEPQDRIEPEFSDIRRIGAAATMFAQYIEQGALQFDKSQREHVAVATALLHGILTDTNGFIRAGEEDFAAAGYLSRLRDSDLLQQVMTQARSKLTMEIIRRALRDRVVVENFSIAGIGYLRTDDRDAIPQAADFLQTEENVHTAIVYGIVVSSDQREESVVGSMRTTKFTMDPDQFIKDVFGKGVDDRYFGGGKPSAGGFEIPVGFLSGDADTEYRDLKWQVYDSQIKRKLFDRIGVQRENE